MMEIKKTDMDKEKKPNVFVFGLPRSGTSMMTHIIELLGIDMQYTTENPEQVKKRDKRYTEKLGKYKPNEEGFFELNSGQWGILMKIINGSGIGCKMIVPVRGFHYYVANQKGNKIILMDRDVEEIRQSQQAFYRGNEMEDPKLRTAILRSLLARQESILKKSEIDVLTVNYQDVLTNPKEEIKKIADFIGFKGDITPAIKSVKPKLNRFNIKNVEVGI